MFEELLISVLFIIVLIILCIISDLYSKKEEKEKYIMLRNSIKEDLKENFISEEEYWQYNKEYSDKIKKIKEDIQLYEEEKETIKNNDTDWMNIFKKKEKINELGYEAIYNHGAMTYTDLGKKFKENLGKKDMPITVSYFFTDLIINTKNIIKPYLTKKNTIVLQDRYFDAITTYIKAYGDYIKSDYNIYDIPKAFVENDILIKPSLSVFCIPPFETIKERMDKSKESPVHDFYRDNPEFFKIVYNELVNKANELEDNIIIDTSSDLSVEQGIDKILEFIKNKIEKE